MRLGEERLITFTVTEPIIQGRTMLGGGYLTHELVREMARDIKSGKRTFFLDGGDK